MPTSPQSPSVRPLNRKPIFAAIRAVLRRGLRQREVERIDGAIDKALDPHSSQTQLPSPPLRAISPAGIALIKRFEGCARLRTDELVEAYPDPGTGGAPWTIGWGATGSGPDGARIGPGTVWTQEQCDQRLAEDLIRYSDDVARAIGNTPTTQAQFDAMVSFHYNTGAINRATLTRKHTAADFAAAASEFHRWNMAGGRTLKGLTRRRAEEARLYAG